MRAIGRILPWFTERMAPVWQSHRSQLLESAGTAFWSVLCFTAGCLVCLFIIFDRFIQPDLAKQSAARVVEAAADPPRPSAADWRLLGESITEPSTSPTAPPPRRVILLVDVGWIVRDPETGRVVAPVEIKDTRESRTRVEYVVTDCRDGFDFSDTLSGALTTDLMWRWRDPPGPLGLPPQPHLAGNNPAEPIILLGDRGPLIRYTITDRHLCPAAKPARLRPPRWSRAWFVWWEAGP